MAKSEKNENPIDDSLASMAAAAAVSVYLKKRSKQRAGTVSNMDGFSLWTAFGRQSAIRNLPNRNNWK